jgi:hypothetical protein
MISLFLPALLTLSAAAAEPHWARQANSLLLYGEDGSLVNEIPLRESDLTGNTSNETHGGASPDGRLAWTLDRRIVWSPGRTKKLESHHNFRTYGTTGQELWHDDSVDYPERGEPVLFSADGKVLLLARRVDNGWIAEARTWLGQPQLTIGPAPRLISMSLTPNGRYALARWSVPDKSDTHTFVDLQTKARKDVQSSELVLGLAHIDDDGMVRSGSKVVFAFETAVSTQATPGK